MIVAFFDELLGLLFPEFANERLTEEDSVRKKFDACLDRLRTIFSLNEECSNSKIPGKADEFFDLLPAIRMRLMLDVDAMFEGDPAAKSRAEVIRSYPGFHALSAYRIAHELEMFGIRIIPRVISEYAHRQTGIDIHPGAKIGEYCCIDHGTGIVIGETTEIGANVKIYQGVTLGALSVSKEGATTKRHPTIEDNVVIYANATILGGKTVIGKNSIIGGNVWLTRSVKPGSKVYYQAKMTNASGDTDTITIK